MSKQIMFSDYSREGAQLNATIQNLDNETPGAVFTSARERHWSYEAVARNPMCQPGQLCNRSYNVGFWRSGDMPSIEKNTSMQLGATQLHTSNMMDYSLSSNVYRQETSDGPTCCPKSCCDRPTGTPFWKINEDSSLLDQYSRNDIAKCMGLADGDQDKLRACLGQCGPWQWSGWSEAKGWNY